MLYIWIDQRVAEKSIAKRGNTPRLLENQPPLEIPMPEENQPPTPEQQLEALRDTFDVYHRMAGFDASKTIKLLADDESFMLHLCAFLAQKRYDHG